MLTRDRIFGQSDLKTEEVDVPEWGGSVLVRTLTARERDDFEQSFVREVKGERTVVIDNIRAALVVRTVVDENGDRLFSDSDAEALGRKSAVAVNRVYDVAQRLAGITGADVDELVKGSSGPQEESSPSG